MPQRNHRVFPQSFTEPKLRATLCSLGAPLCYNLILLNKVIEHLHYYQNN